MKSAEKHAVFEDVLDDDHNDSVVPGVEESAKLDPQRYQLHDSTIEYVDLNGHLYIASIEFEGTISFFGQGNTPEEAFKDFSGTPFREHCDCYEVKSGTQLEVHIHKGIWQDDPEWSDDFDPNWDWALGEKVDAKTLVFRN